jgi:8-oxo-dGTP pyrophosphatase MutT (NUDIX family)
MTTPPISIIPVDDLDLGYADSVWPFAAARAADIEAQWARMTAANPALFNGRVLVLRQGGVHTRPDGRRVFRGTYFATDYKAFLGHRELGYPDSAVSNGFGMAALRASDGGYLVGEMAAHTSIAGRVQFPAGTPDPLDIRRPEAGRGTVDHANAHVDLEASALRELEEETGIKAAALEVKPGWTIVSDGPRVAFMKDMRIAATSVQLAAVVRRFLQAEVAPELVKVYTLKGPGDLTGLNLPQFMRSYLRHMWGQPPDQG